MARIRAICLARPPPVLREDLNLVECWLEFLRVRTSFSSKHAEGVMTGADDRHRVTGRSFPPSSATITGAAAGKAVPRRRLAFGPGAFVAGFVDLGGAIDGALDAFPDEGEAALKGGFSFSQGGVDGVVDRVEQLCDLVNAEESVRVEDEVQNDLTKGESAAFEGRVACVREGIAVVAAPDAGTGIPGLDGGVATLWTGSLFPGLLTAPLDLSG